MRVQRASDVVFRQLESDGGGVLLRLDTGAYHGLNDVGSLIWTLVGDGASVDELVDELEAQVEGAPAQMRSEVEEFLSALIDRGLLTVVDQL